MSCPHCGSEETQMMINREVCCNHECLKPISKYIPCCRCGKELDANDKISQDGEWAITLIQECPECFQLTLEEFNSRKG